MLNHRSFAAIVGFLLVASAHGAYAQPPIELGHWAVVGGIVPAENVRVCLPGVRSNLPRVDPVILRLAFHDQDGRTLLSRRADVPRQGFLCVETSYEELVHQATHVVQQSGFIQFALTLRVGFGEVTGGGEDDHHRRPRGFQDILISSYQISVTTTDASTGEGKTIARLLIDKGFGFIRDESGIEHFRR